MNTTYTSAQFKKFTEILEQRQVNPDRFQAVLGSGLLSDVFEPEAKITNRLAVRQALGLGTLPSDPGRHSVDYSQSFEDMILVGSYDWKNDDITAKRFPLTGKGQVEFEDTLFHFDRNVSSEEAVKLIIAADPKNPWEPGKIENLLAYGAKNPEEQRKYPIVGLGSACGVGGFRKVPYLGGFCSERDLSLDWFGDGWDAYCRFLAVRKQLLVS